MKIYLAGGMRSNWQNLVIAKTIGSNPNAKVTFIDPCNKPNEMSLEEYGTWDLTYIKDSDIIFGYMERSNPSGVGMACELGYAFGIGKTVILVLEENHETQKDRYLNFMKKVSHVVYNNLEDGIKYLNTFI